MVFCGEGEPSFTKGALLVLEKSLYRSLGRSMHMVLSEFVQGEKYNGIVLSLMLYKRQVFNIGDTPNHSTESILFSQ
jgi:hypothetical protein